MFCFLNSVVYGGVMVSNIKDKVVKHTLKNGLKVLILKRDTVQTVSFNMMFKVGSVDEEFGKTGLAHFFEHMMFKGTKALGTKDYDSEMEIMKQISIIADQIISLKDVDDKDIDHEKIAVLQEKLKHLEKQQAFYIKRSEFESTYDREGAQGLNAYTAADVTSFIVNLPKNKVELWMRLESDRFKNPVFREFYKEKEIIIEERRMRYVDSANGKLFGTFIPLAFMEHPYRNPTIGWESDLLRVRNQDVLDFFDRYYVPSNMVVSIVGDVDAEKIIYYMRKYFEDIPNNLVQRNRITKESPQNGRRFSVVYHPSEPLLMCGFMHPSYPDPDDIVFDFIVRLLTSGSTSALYKNIVESEHGIYVSGYNSIPGERYPNMVVFFVSPRYPYGNADIESIIFEQLEKLKNDPISSMDMEKVKKEFKVEMIRNLSSNSDMADELSHNELIHNDWSIIFGKIEQLQMVTPKDVQRVAKKYFKKSNSTVVFLEKLQHEE